jgi:phage terminase large subunit-like protein
MTAQFDDILVSEEDFGLVERWQARNRLEMFYPDSGPLRRELYPKHLAFFAGGAGHRERAAIAANRIGKTEGLGAYELTLHLTGNYPDWWTGKRFHHPVSVWACGKTNQTTRDIVQAKLLGKVVREKGDDPQKPMGLGTGMIPAGKIAATRPKSGAIPNALESAWIKHVSGGKSTLSFKSYEQGRGAFEGTEQDVVWFDEEPDELVYSEGLMRTMATGTFAGGICLLTFTPLAGWSEVVNSFLDVDASKTSGRWVIQMGWDDAPHLSTAEKEEMGRKCAPHERDARMKGIPRLGSGAIYPIEESLIKCDPFAIPPHWPRGYALDVGQHTACIWAAHDRDTDTLYLYHEYFRDDTLASIAVHADAIKARGQWIPGFADPAANARSQIDGQRVIELYRQAGLNLENADNAVEAGIYDVWDRMTAGRWKAFASLARFWQEIRLYRRDEKGKIVKKDDHMMDCARYVTRGIGKFRTQPVARPVHRDPVPVSTWRERDPGSWMG